MDQPRIIIADDHTLVAEAFKSLIEPDYQVIKIVVDGRSLIAAAVEMKPDVVLLDLSMPLLNGIDAGQELKKLLPRTKFIILTMNEDPDVASKSPSPLGLRVSLKKVCRCRTEASDRRGPARTLLCHSQHRAEIN